MTAGDIVLMVVVILAITLIPIVIALYFVRQAQRRRLKEMMARFPNARLIEPALFYGQESAGKAQMRGNGVLALLPERLQFEMLVPRREFSIPLAQITGIESPIHFLGKTNLKPLLKVVYRNEAGEQDAIAWLVVDPASWRAVLEPQ